MEGRIKPSTYNAKLTGKKLLIDWLAVFSFEVVSNTPFSFKAGQYISIKVKDFLRRSYSMYNPPLELGNSFKLLVDLRPDGHGVNFLSKLDTGETIEFTGPLGKFVLPDNKPKNLVFIVTGSGVCPVNSIIETLILSSDYSNHNIYLYFGTKYKKDIIEGHKFLEYLKKGYLKEYKVALSQETEKDDDMVYLGRLTGLLKEFLGKKDIRRDYCFFLCGNGNMIDSVSNMLVKSQIAPGCLFTEKFYVN